MKRKRSVSVTGDIDKTSVQKSLSTFFEEDKEKEEYKIEETKEVELQKEIVEDKIEEKRLSNQIETDYYEKSRIDVCVKRLRERFNIDIDIIPVRYGSKPPINQKIYGYYMMITVKGKGYDNIVEFIEDDCNLKVYKSTTAP